MIDNSQICYRCSIEDCTGECEALNMLRGLVRQVDKERKYELLNQYKAELQLIYAEPDPEMEEMAEKIIDVRQHILSFDWGCKYTIIIPPLQKKVICIK